MWDINTPVIYKSEADIYAKNGINFGVLKHLDSLGLISFESLAGYRRRGFNKITKVGYDTSSFIMEFPKEKDNEMDIGHVLLTSAGQELATICRPKKVSGFVEYILQQWKNQGIKEFTPAVISTPGSENH